MLRLVVVSLILKEDCGLETAVLTDAVLLKVLVPVQILFNASNEDPPPPTAV